jgi:ubiquitin-protein ligase E3 D
LWILAPSIRFSATTSSHPKTKESGEGYDGTLDGQLAMKVFWQMVSVEEAIVLMDKEGVEEVALPQEVIIEIEGCLRTSAGFLPPSARKFQEWEVGLLERYEQRSV